MAEIEAKVKAIIVDKLGVEESQVTNDANFQTDLGADSLDTEKIATVGDAIAYVENAVK